MSARRRLAGLLLAVGGLPLLTWASAAGGMALAEASPLFLAAVVAVALAGGIGPALLAAVGGFLLLNYYLTPPVHSLAVGSANSLVTLAVYVVVALAVSAVVDVAARRTRQAATLATVAGSVLAGGADPLAALLRRLRETFALDSVTLLERSGDLPVEGGHAAGLATGGGHAAGRTADLATGGGHAADRASAGSRAAGLTSEGGRAAGLTSEGGRAADLAAGAGGGHTADLAAEGWRAVASAGEPVAANPADGDLAVAADDTRTLVLRGRRLSRDDRRVVQAFAAQAAVALTQQRLAVAAEGDRVRSALLAAVGHDLRTPLAAAKAAIAGLRSPGVTFGDDDRAELLATAEESLDRLTALVANLLDMSRLQAGTLGMALTAVGLEDVVPRALDELGAPARSVAVDLGDELPTVRADPGLLDRVLVNLLANALRFSPADRPPAVSGHAVGDMVELRIADHGPGITPADSERMFRPFQRLGDRDPAAGVGLGLALSRGLTEAMGGALRPEPTPGGGLTMVVTLPASAVLSSSGSES